LEERESKVSKIAQDRHRCVNCGKWIDSSEGKYAREQRPKSYCWCENPIPSEIVTQNLKTKNHHPTVKPLSLMKYLCTLTKTPTGGIVLDPFAGSGTTLMACKETGRNYIGIEKDKEYVEIAKRRIKAIPEILF